MKLIPCKIKDICSYPLWKKIKSHALGSIYRMNAGLTDVYSFCIYTDGKDWEGSWEYSRYLDEKYEGGLCVNLKDGKLYKITK